MIHVYCCKPNCVYCDKAKEFLDSKHVEYGYTMLDPAAATYPAIRHDLFARSQGNHRTFPFIFVGDTFLGGYTDLLAAADTGRLQELGVEIEADF